MKKSLLLFLFSYSVFSATLYVDINGSQSYTNIQDAINAAPISGWTDIIVYPGVYLENLIVNTNQHLLISSTNEFSEQTRQSTIIDGNATGSCLTVFGNSGWQQGTYCTVVGVTISNGAASAGGGIIGDSQYSSPNNYINVRRCNIVDCHATSNHYTQNGGGIAWTKGTIISNNIIGNSSAYHGGGLAECDGEISYNLIADNYAKHQGGGIYNIQGIVLHNVISNNVAGYGGGMSYIYADVGYNIVTRNYARSTKGGGAYNIRGRSIYNNVFSFNIASSDGGGIYNNSSLVTASDFLNNLICNNISSNIGGGLCNLNACFMLNNTIAGNWSQSEGGGVYNSENTVWMNTIIASNVSESSTSSNIYANGYTVFYYCCVPGETNLNSTSFTTAPMFVDVQNYDYHVSPGSPCVDAGISNMYYPLLPWSDLDGKLRTQNKTDIGCYERGSLRDGDGDLLIDSTEAALHANSNKWDTNGDGYPDGLHISRGQSVVNVLTNQVLNISAGEALQAGLANSVPGDTILIGAGTYRGLLLPYLGANIQGATNSAGDLLTVIDGENKRPAMIYCRAAMLVPWGVSHGLTSLVISNGNANVGGGINYIRYNTDLGMNNCLFVNNRANNGGGIGRPMETYAGLDIISQCTFIGNTALSEGGGLYNLEPYAGINISTFKNNTASNGAAIARLDGSVERCTVSGNTASGYGGGFYKQINDIRNCLIKKNSAGYGGGIAEYNYPYSGIQNNTICGNSASQIGGGIFESNDNYKFLNNIMWGNVAPSNAQVFLNTFTTNYFHNTIQDWPWLQNNNYSNNPDFTDFTGGDFHLKTNSYCIDFGTNTPDFIYNWLGLDGNFRVINDVADRGCYELYPPEDFDFNSATQRFIVVVYTPGGGRIFKKVVVTGGGSLFNIDINNDGAPGNVQTSVGSVSYPPPESMGITRRVVTTGDNSLLWVDDFGMGYYNGYYWGSDVQGWNSLYDILGYNAYYLTDVFPRDGYPGSYGASYDNYYDNISGFTYNDPVGHGIYTATLPIDTAVITDTLGLPGDSWVASGEDGSGTLTSWGLQPDPADPYGGNVFTATLGGYYGDNPSSPGYVDVDGTTGWDSDKVWEIDETSGELSLEKVIDNTTFYTMTTPLPGGGDYLIGSFPGGVAVSEYGGTKLYTYVYEPTTPSAGTWCTDVFKYVIEHIGYTTTREVIPEPLIAVLLYLAGAFALYKILKK